MATKLEDQKKQAIPAAGQNTLATISDLSAKLNLIETKEKDKYLVSQKVINEVVLRKMPDIRVTEFNYSTSSAGSQIKIRGVAPSRERLLLFRKSLEDDVAFKQVDLPISHFVKGSNIQFDINLIPS